MSNSNPSARATVSVQRKVNVDSALSGALIEPNARRVALIINAPPTNRFTVSLEATAVLDEGVTLYPTNDPLVLTLASHGDLVTRQWNALSATAAQDVTVVEVYSRS